MANFLIKNSYIRKSVPSAKGGEGAKTESFFGKAKLALAPAPPPRAINKNKEVTQNRENKVSFSNKEKTIDSFKLPQGKSFEECFKKVSGRKFNENDEENFELIGEGEFGYVFKYEDCGTRKFCCLKLIKEGVGSHLVSVGEKFRKWDFVNIYLNGKNGKKIPNVLCNSGYYLKCSGNDDNPFYCYVSSENATQAKSIMRKLSEEYSNVDLVALEMPYVQGDSLAELSLKGVENKKHRKNIAKRLVETLCIAHKQGIFHRDIKPDNIQYDIKNNELKLMDFGLSIKISKKDSENDFLKIGAPGTPQYISTKVIEKNENFDPWEDFHALAITLLETKYGPNIGDMLCFRFFGGYNFREDPGLARYRRNHPDKSYLRCLLEYSLEKVDVGEVLIVEKEVIPVDKEILNEAINDLDNHDLEILLCEELFAIALQTERSSDVSQGRISMYKEYFQKLDQLMGHAFLQEDVQPISEPSNVLKEFRLEQSPPPIPPGNKDPKFISQSQGLAHQNASPLNSPHFREPRPMAQPPEKFLDKLYAHKFSRCTWKQKLLRIVLSVLTLGYFEARSPRFS